MAETVIYNCKRCKTGRRVNYDVRTSSGAFCRTAANGKLVRPGIWVEAIGGGRPTVYGGDVEMGLCSSCNRAMTYGKLEGRVNLEHKCDARCTSARGHNCECQCGGENHGSALGRMKDERPCVGDSRHRG